MRSSLLQRVKKEKPGIGKQIQVEQAVWSVILFTLGFNIQMNHIYMLPNWFFLIQRVFKSRAVKKRFFGYIECFV